MQGEYKLYTAAQTKRVPYNKKRRYPEYCCPKYYQPFSDPLFLGLCQPGNFMIFHKHLRDADLPVCCSARLPRCFCVGKRLPPAGMPRCPAPKRPAPDRSAVSVQSTCGGSRPHSARNESRCPTARAMCIRCQMKTSPREVRPAPSLPLAAYRGILYAPSVAPVSPQHSVLYLPHCQPAATLRGPCLHHPA